MPFKVQKDRFSSLYQINYGKKNPPRAQIFRFFRIESRNKIILIFLSLELN